MRCARHKRPIDRRYGADLRFSLAGRALGGERAAPAFRENSETRREIAMVL